MQTHPEARFLVVGEGPSTDDIERIFEAQQVKGQLILPGQATGNDLADAYQAMDLFVFTSKTETQGMVLVEAMAAGKPVIALEASGSREVVEDNVNGLLLPQDASPVTFSRAMEEYLKDSKKAAEWRRGARKTAIRFSRKNTAEKLEQFYESTIADYEKSKPDDEMDIPGWSSLLSRIKTEWELFSEKTAAAVNALSSAGKDDLNPG
jgi:glycosyltransferase involved in cell wall biosynthesis